MIPQCKKIEEWLTEDKSETLVLESQGGIVIDSVIKFKFSDNSL